MHNPGPHTNPLQAAAKETMAVAKEAKSPLLEQRVAIITMITSALATTAIAVLHGVHMLKRDLKKNGDHGQDASRSQPPPHRNYHAAAAGDDGPGPQRRWTNKPEITQHMPVDERQWAANLDRPIPARQR